MTDKRWVAALALLAMSQGAFAGPNSYFRLKVDPGASTPSGGSGGTDSNPGGSGQNTPQGSSPSSLYVSALSQPSPSVAVGHRQTASYAYRGGTPPYVARYANVPAGMAPSYSDATSTLTGVPTTFGLNPSASLTVTDSATPQNVTTVTVPAFAVSNVAPLSITGQDFATPYVVGTSSSMYLFPNGRSPYTVTASGLPEGMTVQDGFFPEIDFTPQSLGDHPSGQVVVTDGNGATGTFNTSDIQVVPDSGNPIVVSSYRGIPSSVATTGPAVDVQYQVNGGSGNYSLASVSLPAGLTANLDYQTVEVTGSPTSPGQGLTVSFVVTDDMGNSTPFTSSPFLAYTPDPLVAVASPDFPSSLPPHATAEADYYVSGGVPPYSASLPDLPNGLSAGLEGGMTQVFASSPVPVAIPSVTITFTDALGNSTTVQTSALSVAPTTSLSVFPNPDLPSTAAVGDTLYADYVVAGGTPPYAIASTALPQGLTGSMQGFADVVGGTVTQSGAVGYQISGNAALPDTYRPVTVTVTDAVGAKASFTTASLTVTGTATPLALSVPDVVGPVPFGRDLNSVYPSYNGTPTPPYLTGGSSYASASGGVQPVVLSVDPNPYGIYLSNDYGAELYGTPPVGTVTGLTVRATDAAGATQVHVLPDFEVTSSTPSTLSFTEADDIAGGSTGDTVSALFAVGGGQPDAFYQFALEGAPDGLSVSQPYPGAPYAKVEGTLGQAGSFAQANLRVYDGTTNVYHAIPPFSVTPGNGLCVILQPTPNPTYDDYNATVVGGQVGCGTPPYTYRLVGGSGPITPFVAPGSFTSNAYQTLTGFKVVFDTPCEGGSEVQGCSPYYTADPHRIGSYRGYSVAATDAKGLSITTQTFGFDVAGQTPKDADLRCDSNYGPLGPIGPGAPLTVSQPVAPNGDTVNLGVLIHYSNAVGPVTVTSSDDFVGLLRAYALGHDHDDDPSVQPSVDDLTQKGIPTSSPYYSKPTSNGATYVGYAEGSKPFSFSGTVTFAASNGSCTVSVNVVGK